MSTVRFYPGTLANQQTMINKLDALARQEMTLGPCHYANMKYTAGTGVALRWKDPNDTIVQGFTWATWVRTVIVRKEGSDPTGPTDGTAVVTETIRDQYLNSAYVDANGTANSHYRAFPFSTAGAYSIASENIFKDYTVFTCVIDEGNSDESTCVSYEDACTDFSPIAMDFENDEIDMGSWANAFFMPRPCMLHRADADHETAYVDYYLDPSDYTKREDGVTASDVANSSYDGNAMMEFPKVFLKTERYGYKIKISVSDTKADQDFECWNCKKSDGTYADHFYLPIYEGSMVNGVMRSISTGSIPANSTNASTEWSNAIANNVGSEQGWGTTLWADEQLIRALGYMVMKRLNSQAAIGGSWATRGGLILNCGAGNTLGMFYGKDETTSGTYTTCKFFGMENWWGHRWRRAQGIVVIGYLVKAKMTLSTIDGSTGGMVQSDAAGDYGGYIGTNISLSPMSSTYTTRLCVDKLASMINGGGSGGSSSTWYCDAAWSSNGTRGVLCGGSVGNGLISGLSALLASDSHSAAYWNCGASLSYHHF